MFQNIIAIYYYNNFKTTMAISFNASRYSAASFSNRNLIWISSDSFVSRITAGKLRTDPTLSLYFLVGSWWWLCFKHVAPRNRPRYCDHGYAPSGISVLYTTRFSFGLNITKLFIDLMFKNIPDKIMMTLSNGWTNVNANGKDPKILLNM